MTRYTPPLLPHRPTTRSLRGLALVELVVVLVILAVIAIVAVPRLGRAETDAPQTSTRGDLAVLRNAIELYAADHNGVYPPLKNFKAALTLPLAGQGPYLQAIPGRAASAPANANSPRIAALTPAVSAPTNTAHGSPHGETTPASRPLAVWLYDEHTGRIQPHAHTPR